jgi:RNA polymerase sigma factor (sigma-70 family)
MSQGNTGRPDRPQIELDREIFSLIMVVLLNAGTRKGMQAFERLAIILTRPIKRIVRTKLELYLPREEINSSDLDAIANEALLRFYLALPRFKPGRSVFPWLKKVIGNLAIDWVRRERRTRAPNAPAFVPLNEQVFLVAAPGSDADERLSIEQFVEGLPPLIQDVVRLTIEDHSAVEIAKRVDKSPQWVRKELKLLGPRFRALLSR